MPISHKLVFAFYQFFARVFRTAFHKMSLGVFAFCRILVPQSTTYGTLGDRPRQSQLHYPFVSLLQYLVPFSEYENHLHWWHFVKSRCSNGLVGFGHFSPNESNYIWGPHHVLGTGEASNLVHRLMMASTSICMIDYPDVECVQSQVTSLSFGK